LHRNTKINDAISFFDEDNTSSNPKIDYKKENKNIDKINHVKIIEDDIEMQDQNNSL
jgi:hypothetical protein